MKKIVALPLVAALALSTMACAKKDADSNAVDGNVVLNDEAAIGDNFSAADDLTAGNDAQLNAADADTALGNADGGNLQ